MFTILERITVPWYIIQILIHLKLSNMDINIHLFVLTKGKINQVRTTVDSRYSGTRYSGKIRYSGKFLTPEILCSKKPRYSGKLQN